MFIEGLLDGQTDAGEFPDRKKSSSGLRLEELLIYKKKCPQKESGSFRPLSRSPLSRFAHFPFRPESFRPRVVSPTLPFAPESFRPLPRSPLSRFAPLWNFISSIIISALKVV